VRVIEAAPDRQLWAQTRQGDPEAFAEIYERHVDAVLNHCFRRTGSWQLAEDLTSSVFLETWRRRHVVELDLDGSMLPWLLGTANNVIRHQMRSLLRHRKALARLPHSVTGPDLSDEAVARVDAETRMRQVLGVMKRLTLVEQEVIALCVWAGLGYADAAVAMGVPIGTVRSRLARARERLRELAPDAPREMGGS
jgi:RNA polymerase sigma-70 factor (ECF subfamily)